MTLTHGIYGQVLEGDDVIHDENCKQYAQPVSYPVWLETADGVRVAEDVADDRGAFELVTASGEYKACARDNNNNVRCGGMVTVPASGRMRSGLRPNADVCGQCLLVAKIRSTAS